MKKLICFVVTLVSMLAFSLVAVGQTNGNTQIVKISKQEFLSKIFDYTAPDANYKGDIPAIVDFYADWCGPCRKMSPALSAFATEQAGKVSVVKVNVDRYPDLSQKYKVGSIPYRVLFKDGKVVDTRVGMQSLAQLRSWVAPE